MSEIKKILDKSEEILISLLDKEDMFIEERVGILQACSLYVIARVIADLDEVECLYPPKKDVV